jgi:hypothetical protein
VPAIRGHRQTATHVRWFPEARVLAGVYGAIEPARSAGFTIPR